MEWYYGVEGRQTGPVSADEIRAMVVAGQLGPQTMVWRDGLPAWQPLTAFPELCSGQPAMMGYGAPVAPVSGLAIASLVCGIVSIFLCYVHAVAAIPAVVCGHMAMKRIRDSAVPTGGRGLAIGGLVTGYLGIMAQLATLAFIGFFVFSMAKTTSSRSSGFLPTPSGGGGVSSPVAPAVPGLPTEENGGESEEEEGMEEGSVEPGGSGGAGKAPGSATGAGEP